MTCLQWVDEGHFECTSSTDEVSEECSEWADEGKDECAEWADEGKDECAEWADEGKDECAEWSDQGKNECNAWADNGHNECCTWKPCKWFCDALVWIANVVCVGFYWVANLVCKGFYWVANLVCQGFYWVANLVCKFFYWAANLVCQAFAYFIKAVCLVASWFAKIVCAVWDQGSCAVNGLLGDEHAHSSPVKHVFVLMMENRSFDHMLGLAKLHGHDLALGADRDADDVRNPDAFIPDPADPANPAKHVKPGPEAAFRIKKPEIDPPHGFKDMLTALCGAGAVYQPGQPYPPVTSKGYLASYADHDPPPGDVKTVMKCYSRFRVPIISQLADEFTVCDRWFSSVPGPTWPNRLFMHAASSAGLDDSASGLTVFGNAAFDGYVFHNGTIFDRLDDACLEWRVFADDEFPVTLGLSGMTINDLTGRISAFSDFAEAVAEEDYSPAYTFIEPNYGNIFPEDNYLCGNSQHPVDDVTRGERLIKSVYESIRNSPRWQDSLLLLVYDESGGFYDHAIPPSAVPPGDGEPDEDNVHHQFDFTQLGPRVPAIVISCKVARGGLDGTTYDHTSLLATLEGFFNLNSLTERDAAARDFSHLLSWTARADTPATLGEPADSGFACPGEEPKETELGEVSSGLGNGLGESEARDPSRWTQDQRPVDSTLRGFQEIALMKALRLARGRDRAQIRKEYLAARTQGGARYFMYKVAHMARGHRREATRRGLLARWLLPPSQRPWQADPIHVYRQAKASGPSGRPAAPAAADPARG